MSAPKIISLQFALFFRDIIERPDVEFSDLNENMMNIFDAMPSIIPIPRELPPEVPIVTQRSESNEYICNISRSRIDLHFQRIDDKRSNEKILIDFNAKIIGFITYVLKNRKIVRFGMVCRYFRETPNAIQCIKTKYFTDSIGDVSELSFRYNKKSNMEDWEINDIVEIYSATAVIEGKETNGIYVQRDINNNSRLDKPLTEKSLQNISRRFASYLTEKSIEELLQ